MNHMQSNSKGIHVPQCIEAFCVGRRCRDFASYGNIVLGCRREKRLRVVRRIKEAPTIAPLKTVTNIVLPGKYFRADFGIRHRRIQHMKIAYVSALVLFASFVGQSASAADWQIVASPSFGTGANSLVGVASAADNDVWAVGWAWNNGLSVYRTVIEHWNGATWSLIRSPNATNGYNLLNGVAVVAANDVWTVGQAANGNTYKTLVEHWNGAAWSIVPSPNVVGSSSALTALSVVSANNIWAVGYSTDSNFINRSLTMHWNGAAWSIVPSPSVANDILFAVDVVASNDVWAVGRSKPPYGEDRTLTLHWDGSAWNIVQSPNDSTNDNTLFGVATVASNDVWAVGNAGSLKTLAIHWDGASWSVVPTPALNPNDTNPVLVGIVALSSNNIWTAGQFIVPVEGSAQHTLTENWNGSRWTVVPSPNAKNSNNRLHGITATPSDTLWAVGTTGVFGQPERTLILRKNP